MPHQVSFTNIIIVLHFKMHYAILCKLSVFIFGSFFISSSFLVCIFSSLVLLFVVLFRFRRFVNENGCWREMKSKMKQPNTLENYNNETLNAHKSKNGTDHGMERITKQCENVRWFVHLSMRCIGIYLMSKW